MPRPELHAAGRLPAARLRCPAGSALPLARAMAPAVAAMPALRWAHLQAALGRSPTPVHLPAAGLPQPRAESAAAPQSEACGQRAPGD